MAFMTIQQLQKMGFKSLGNNVYISNRASIYGAERISIGNNVRIDDFSVLSSGEGGIIIGSYVHIAINASLIGAGKITVSDYANISSRVAIYSSNDDYSGNSMTNPMLPVEYTSVAKEDVTICRHVILGCGSVILPGVTLNEGCAVGSLSLINKDCEPFSIYAGVPAKKIKNRSKKILELEASFISNLKQ
ncbi:acyltransferase [Citrobacter sp. Cf039]|uniref:acyltransferase n=1 Tax=Citrobacter TaxID=544 RepID=UPI001C709B26|nr:MULTISPECIES: acyltransferase [Citrobacter]EJB5573596.1 acyltransferase [Citrobacter freundii]MBW9589679.1 acyltransferase [Citrobacter freundii]MDM3266906.1 acyltransferase [Citrobacter sp. Cf039]MDM3344539.1 acyltransferase [Citrobacter sp. Cf115]MDS0959120.1 acyltransferase [Citrobacter freundii]